MDQLSTSVPEMGLGLEFEERVSQNLHVGGICADGYEMNSYQFT